MKNLLLIAITILAVGCGGKDESTNETKPVEEKVLEVKEDAKPEEAVVETKPELEGVNWEEELEPREGLAYVKGSDAPYTGKMYGLYENGQKKLQGNYKNGKRDGLWVVWHENGQKKSEGNYKDGNQDGPITLWHKNGQKSQEVNWKDGKKEGLNVKWHDNGQKQYEANFKDHKLDGLTTSWHKNGQKRSEVNYKDGELISKKYWNSKGEEVETEGETFR